jgi:glc operon protein GlcG
MPHSRAVHVVSLEGARALIAAGRAEAARRGWAVAIAVVEPSGDLIAFEMMDGTQPASQAIAIAKARTAARLRRSTRLLEDIVAGGRVAMLSIEPDAVLLEGGVPIMDGDHFIGAIGVSGMTSALDGEIAAVALEALHRPE